MPDTTCQVDECDQPVTTGSSICPNCRNKLRNALEEIPGLWIDLRVTMGRQKAASYTGATAASRETPLPVHLPALLARDYLAKTVTAWTRETGLLTGKPCTYEDIPSQARWLGDTPNFGTLTRSAAAHEAVEELTQGAIQEARQVIDTPPGRIYTGPCNSLGAIKPDGTPCDTVEDAAKAEIYGCGGPLYIKETDRYDPTARCTKCTTTYDQQTRRKWVSAQYVGLYVTVAEASLLLGESRKTLQQRIRRNQIKPRGTLITDLDASQAAAYLLDDLMAEAPTTATERHLEAKYNQNTYPKAPITTNAPQQALSRACGA